MKQIILASGSPRRHELLNLLEIPHLVIPCNEEEEQVNNHLTSNYESIKKQLIKVAIQKARCVEKTLDLTKNNSIIIGADTIVVFKEEIIGKPESKEDAILMLKKIMGNTHIVYTGLCVLNVKTGEIYTDLEKTLVSMIEISEEKIEVYINSENIFDKAGSYAIQGKGAALIEKIEGCYYNVMGLPLSKLIKLLGKAGYNYLAR